MSKVLNYMGEKHVLKTAQEEADRKRQVLGYYPKGTKFIRFYSKNKELETIEDIYLTRNLEGDLIRILYVTSKDVLGQKVTDYSVPESTITRSNII